MVNFKLGNESVKSEPINMTRVWNKENPVGAQIFFLFHAPVMFTFHILNFCPNLSHRTECDDFHSSYKEHVISRNLSHLKFQNVGNHSIRLLH